MSQSGFTPIQLYRSTTAAAVPLAGNLAAGELAINLTDEKLYFKNAAGVVKVLADSTATGTVTSVAASGGTTGLSFTGSPITSTGTLTLSGTLVAANGGTGQSSYTIGDILFASTSTALSKLADVATGNALISGGVGVAPAYGKIGLTTHVSGTLPVASGGTGQTTYTDGQLLIGNTTGNTLAKATLTAGSGITITNGSGAITIAATAGGGGTVTSVNASGGTTGLTFSGGPVTTSGTLTLAGTLAVTNGGTGGTTASAARSGIGAAASGAVGSSGLTMNTARMLGRTTASAGAIEEITIGTGLSLSAGTLSSTASGGTVTSVAASGGTTGLSFTGSPITTSGTLTLTGTLAVANGGTGATTASAARTGLGATTVGANFFTLTNPSSVTFVRINADNTISTLDAATFRTAIGAGTSSTTGTVTSVAGTGTVNGLSLSGTVTSSGNITLSGSVTSVATTATIDGVTIGYRSIPRSTTSGTAVVADVGKCIAVTAGITIPNSTFAAGDAVSIYNDSASAITITAGVTTLRLAGTATTGNRTLAARGLATVWFNSATEAIISGAGVT
jgi:hypothetical protein